MNTHAADPVVSTPPAMPRTGPSFVTAALRVFDLSLGQMLWSRRTVFLALVVGAPLALGILFRVLEVFGIGPRMGQNVISGTTVFGGMMWLLYLRFIVPVLGVFYGTALVADEVEDKTITYLFVRPVPRSAVLAGKYLAYLATTVFVVLPSVVLLFLLVVPMGQGSLAGAFPDLLVDLGLLALGLAAYGAVFAFIGAWLKYPLVTGLFFAFGWEQVAMALPGYLRKFTVAYYLQALVPHSMPTEGLGSVLQALFREVPSPATSIGYLLGMTVVFVYLAGRIIGRREYVLEQ
jgi:ABC-type transport system involved in multi-copper enzyme maturation permease subunit